MTYFRVVVHEMFSTVNKSGEPRRNNVLSVVADTLQYITKIYDTRCLAVPVVPHNPQFHLQNCPSHKKKCMF